MGAVNPVKDGAVSARDPCRPVASSTIDSQADRCNAGNQSAAERGPEERVIRSGRLMAPDIQESRAALILLAVVVGAVLLFGAFTLVTQIG